MKNFLQITLFCILFSTVHAQTKLASFDGEKTSWHGFDRFDFMMDDETLEVVPFKAPDGEKDGVGTPPKGKRRCIVVVPAKVAKGNPWSWQACYWNHEPQTEVELLKRGFHIVFITPDPGKQWDAWYDLLTTKYALASKPAFVGMSKGGVNEYDWTTVNPQKVSCIYADNPAIREETFARLGALAKNDVPLLNVCGTSDFLLEKHTLAIEKRYQELGGRITVMIKEGPAHHPHSIKDPKTVADWIESNMKLEDTPLPSFIDSRFVKSYYYNLDSKYVYLKEEDTYAVSRGPGFTPCYARYDVKSGSPWGLTAMGIIVPEKAASGKPWVLRAGNVHREDVVDQALLAKGYHIVITPITAQAGALRNQWDSLYQFMTDNGFSAKPVLEGNGAYAGEIYAWAETNPGKVAAIFGENPVFRSLMSPTVLLDNLAPLAKAGVPIMHVSGSMDPWLENHSRALQKKYKSLGGKVTIIEKPGEGHFLLIKDTKPIIDFIQQNSRVAGMMRGGAVSKRL